MTPYYVLPATSDMTDPQTYNLVLIVGLLLDKDDRAPNDLATTVTEARIHLLSVSPPPGHRYLSSLDQNMDMNLHSVVQPTADMFVAW